MLSVGCTSGHHRSPVVANVVRDVLEASGNWEVKVIEMEMLWPDLEAAYPIITNVKLWAQGSKALLVIFQLP